MYKSQNSCQFQAEISDYGSCLFGGKPLKNQFNDLKLPISQAEKAVKPRRVRLTTSFSGHGSARVGRLPRQRGGHGHHAPGGHRVVEGS